MKVAELLGKIAQMCYEITTDGQYTIEFAYYPIHNMYGVSLKEIVNCEKDEFLGELKTFVISNEKIDEMNLRATIVKLDNMEQTYKDLVKE